MDLKRLSKTISHALRHNPWRYELELDAEGWVPLDELIESLRHERREWRELELADLERMIAASDKQRFEINGGRIRAYYGHSVPQRIVRHLAEPPEVLYHGTPPSVVQIIREEGLRPMRRQYVHLSSDVETAHSVGARRASRPTILTIRAREAYAAGIAFYHGNETVWLADRVPPQFIGEEHAS